MTQQRRFGTYGLFWCGAGTILVTATLASAQPQTTGAASDRNWLPWMGCWQLVEETGALGDEAGDPRRFADRVLVCIDAAGEPAAVQATTMADGSPVLVETLHADGEQHTIDEETCTGWRRNRWSRDGARLFTQAELVCEGSSRRVSGVGLMADERTWLDLQFVDSGDRGAVTVRRYRRASDAAIGDAGGEPLSSDLRARAATAARLNSTSPLSIDDVIEAGQIADPAVVEALLVESDAEFALDGRSLVRLDDGRVPPTVIDLMVALSFPEAFSLQRSRGGSGGGGAGGFGAYDPYAFSGWYPYYAAPFGYYYGWSPYNSLYYLGPASTYAVVPGGGGIGAGSRVYEGRGYTRIDRRPEPPPTARTAQRRGDGGGGGTQAATRGGSGGSSGGRGVSSGGYSRGGSSGRSARPRQ